MPLTTQDSLQAVRQNVGGFQPIAIVGMNALFPGSTSLRAFWDNIVHARDLLTAVPETHFLLEDYYAQNPGSALKTWAKKGGFIPDVDFDPLDVGIPPAVLPQTDVVQLLALKVAKDLLRSVKSLESGLVDRKNVGVILGIASATSTIFEMSGKLQKPVLLKALREAGLPSEYVTKIADAVENSYSEWTENTFPGLLGNVVAGRIANRLDLGGTNCVIDAACASSLAAITAAIQELQLGTADMMITGGADALNNILMYMCFTKTPALSQTNDCRPFSDEADGTMMCEGLGMVALRRLSDAERDGDRIFAVIRGLGTSSDGRSKSVYAPVAAGQALALRRAYQSAGYSSDEVELVEAHGTATKAGDVAEFEGLCLAFGTDRPKQSCALGSIKSQMGHAKAAAGAASIVKIALALHQKVLPPTIKVNRPNPKLNIDETCFYLNTKTRPWVRAPGTTRKASVSSFGFGGSNFHLTLEEYPQKTEATPRLHTTSCELLLWSADSKQELLEALKSAVLQASGPSHSTTLCALSQHTQLAFIPTKTHRLALVVSSWEELHTAGDACLALLTKHQGPVASLPRSIGGATFFYADTAGQGPQGQAYGRIAFLFPGQGSQYLHMAGDVACAHDDARQVWDRAAAAFAQGRLSALDRPLHQFAFPVPVFSGQEEADQLRQLSDTSVAQPAIAVTSASYLSILERCGIRADCVAGHSLGELSALYAAGVFASFEDFCHVAGLRGHLMAQASGAHSNQGGMTAVVAPRLTVQDLLQKASSPLSLVNENSPSQIVVAGSLQDLGSFESLLQEQRIAYQRLPVSTAFHTHFVADAASHFAEALRPMAHNKPRIPVYGNATGLPYKDKDSCFPTLAEQLAKPVKFHTMLQNMYDDGVRIFIEVGPSSVLTRLVGECLPHADVRAVALNSKSKDGLTALWSALGQLAVCGLPVQFGSLWQGVEGEEPAPKLSPAAVKICGANYKKPYPHQKNQRILPHDLPPLAPLQAVPQPALQQQPVVQTRQPTVKTLQPKKDLAPMTTPNQPQSSQNADWFGAFQQMQDNILQAQAHYLQVMSESHKAFLRVSEATIEHMGRSLGMGSPSAGLSLSAPRSHEGADKNRLPAFGVPFEPARPVAAPQFEIPRTIIQPPVAPPQASRNLEAVALAPRVAFEAASHAPVAAAIPASRQAPVSVSIPVATPAAPSAPAALGDKLDVKALLLGVVADKTGYPAEMLGLEMHLEADLGIDSIKRVEILSELQSKLPQLAQLDTAKMALLSTLQEILDFSLQAQVSLASEKKKMS